MTVKHYALAGNNVAAYSASPIDPRGAAILVLPEIYNLNGWVRDVAQRYAGQGFEVLVPDLFWRQVAQQDLPYTPEGQQAGRQLAGALDRAVAVQDLARLVQAWRKELPAGTPVLTVGYCLGGELAYLLAAAGAVDAASAYYPTRMENHLEHGAGITVPTQLHFGELDYRTPAELINAVRDATASSGQVENIVHTGADHGFGRFGHPPFHAVAAARAQRETLALIDGLLAIDA